MKQRIFGLPNAIEFSVDDLNIYANPSVPPQRRYLYATGGKDLDGNWLTQEQLDFINDNYWNELYEKVMEGRGFFKTLFWMFFLGI